MSDTDRRADLAAALAELRRERGLLASTVAQRADMSRAKLSKLERGRITATIQDVERILTALDVSAEVREQFLAMTRVARTEQRAWRIYYRLGFYKKQQEIAAIEAQTATLRLFQPALVPGLLQTPEYMRGIFEGRSHLSAEVQGRTVAARLERQRVIHDPTKTFHFLMTEAALRSRVTGRPIMALQLDRLISVSRLPNLTIGVIPFSACLPDFPMAAFCLFDDRLVSVETFHSEITVHDPKDVALHMELFHEFEKVALSADDALEFIARLVEELRTEE